VVLSLGGGAELELPRVELGLEELESGCGACADFSLQVE
jgi:hypothetical protein